MTITEFLEDRIAEDEAAAKKAIEWIVDGPNPGVAWYNEANRKTFGGAYNLITTHAPARVLAECAAKRAIVDLYRNGVMGEIFDGEKWINPLAPLAAIYRDHPDYQQEWAL